MLHFVSWEVASTEKLLAANRSSKLSAKEQLLLCSLLNPKGFTISFSF